MSDREFNLLPVDSIQVGSRIRRETGSLEGLQQSIQEIGLLHPIVVTAEHRLLAGYRRLMAFRELGLTEIPAHVVRDLTEYHQFLQVESDENTERKELLPSEMVRRLELLEEWEREQARERQRRTQLDGRDAEGNPVFGSVKFTEPKEKSQTRDRVARVGGVSGPTYAKAKAVVQAAEEEPEKYQPLQEEMDRTGNISGAYRKLQVQRQVEQLEQELPPLPTGPFHVIIVDPPWAYEKRSNDVTQRGQTPYPTLTIEEIRALPVGSLAGEDSLLWLWTTNAHLPMAFEILQAWGFAYKTCLTRVKPKMGLGDWLRGQTEHCLLGVRGRPVVTLTSQTTVLTAPLRDHSRKPEEFYQLVEALCPGTKLELFARAERPGWVCHGNPRELLPG